MGDSQAYVPILPTPPGIPPELAQETRQHALHSHLQLSGEEVRTFFNSSFLYLTGSQTFKFQGPFFTLKNY